jgi:hypothetical protein
LKLLCLCTERRLGIFFYLQSCRIFKQIGAILSVERQK